MTQKSQVDDLTVIFCEFFQGDPSLGRFRGEPTLLHESIPSSLEPPTTGVTTRTVREYPPPVKVSFRLPIAPAPVPVGLAATPALLHLPVLAAAPVLVAPDTTDVEVAEAQVVERPQPPNQDARFADSSDI